MKNFLVIGNPIKHSLSPLVHNYWIGKEKKRAQYDKKQIEEKQLPQVIEGIRENKISGVNVTVPFKQKIIKLSVTIPMFLALNPLYKTKVSKQK